LNIGLNRPERSSQSLVQALVHHPIPSKGITDAVTEIGKENLDFLNRIKPLAMKILAGFGIAESKQGEILSPYVHAAVIGAVFIKEIMNTGEGNFAVKPLLSTLKAQGKKWLSEYGCCSYAQYSVSEAWIPLDLFRIQGMLHHFPGLPALQILQPPS